MSAATPPFGPKSFTATGPKPVATMLATMMTVSDRDLAG